jgi:hypothetical protein
MRWTMGSSSLPSGPSHSFPEFVEERPCSLSRHPPTPVCPALLARVAVGMGRSRPGTKGTPGEGRARMPSRRCGRPYPDDDDLSKL